MADTWQSTNWQWQPSWCSWRRRLKSERAYQQTKQIWMDVWLWEKVWNRPCNSERRKHVLLEGLHSTHVTPGFHSWLTSTSQCVQFSFLFFFLLLSLSCFFFLVFVLISNWARHRTGIMKQHVCQLCANKKTTRIVIKSLHAWFCVFFSQQDKRTSWWLLSHTATSDCGPAGRESAFPPRDRGFFF